MRLINRSGAVAFALAGALTMGTSLLLCGCEVHDHGYAQVDVVDAHGYKHHGYYDEHHDWHGGYYDEHNGYHEDAHDWHQ